MMDRFIFSLKSSLCLAAWILSASLLSPPLYALSDEIPYGTGSWDSDSLGNHRVIIQVNQKADALWAHIPWRRRDANPEKKVVKFRVAKNAKERMT